MLSRWLLSIYLCGFLLSAVIAAAPQWPPLEMVRTIVHGIALGLGIFLVIAAPFWRRLPKAPIILPMLLATVDWMCRGYPLAFLLPNWIPLALTLAQAVLSAALLFFLMRWARTPPPLDRPPFSWASLAFSVLFLFFLLPFSAASLGIKLFADTIERDSDGYVKLRPAGLVLEERELSKDGKQVRLIGMIHVGESRFYDYVLASLSDRGPATVLVEGVTDDQGLLRGRFSYAGIARLLGLSAQEKSSFTRKAASGLKSKTEPDAQVRYVRADVDISSFDPFTVALIQSIGALLANPSWKTWVQETQRADAPFVRLSQDESLTDTVRYDLFDRRNAALCDHIDAVLPDSRTVVVPWGAAHLPAIQSWLKTQGFSETRRVERTAWNFWR